MFRGCNTRIRTAFIRDALAARDSGFRRKLRLMIARIRSNLPIYILAGDNDQRNHHLEWLKPSVQRYPRAVLRDVTEKYYPGGRHEMLNEINRDEVRKIF